MTSENDANLYSPDLRLTAWKRAYRCAAAFHRCFVWRTSRPMIAFVDASASGNGSVPIATSRIVACQGRAGFPALSSNRLATTATRRHASVIGTGCGNGCSSGESAKTLCVAQGGVTCTRFDRCFYQTGMIGRPRPPSASPRSPPTHPAPFPATASPHRAAVPPPFERSSPGLLT